MGKLRCNDMKLEPVDRTATVMQSFRFLLSASSTEMNEPFLLTNDMSRVRVILGFVQSVRLSDVMHTL